MRHLQGVSWGGWEGNQGSAAPHVVGTWPRTGELSLGSRRAPRCPPVPPARLCASQERHHRSFLTPSFLTPSFAGGGVLLSSCRADRRTRGRTDPHGMQAPASSWLCKGRVRAWGPCSPCLLGAPLLPLAMTGYSPPLSTMWVSCHPQEPDPEPTSASRVFSVLLLSLQGADANSPCGQPVDSWWSAGRSLLRPAG